ncbi:hypothetical protein NDA01_18460 [Trichocoleus desertorum AS-A10]|uniref:hypothetical protein n=1 Tax=Trichocoleus desertorum TaxID=1481672 RepID=UPI003296C19B
MGYIAPESPISDYDRDVVFFEGDLEELDFEVLQKGMELGFILEQRQTKTGDIEWVARDVRKFVAPPEKKVIPIPTSTKSKANPESPVNIYPSSYRTFLEKLSDSLKSIEKINDSGNFEDAVFSLLRLLGIHSVYQYSRDAQAGKADGFFILENLAVMYDCTLRNPFEEYKKDQIENYIHKLSNKSQLTIETRKADGGRGSKTLQIQGKSRQVWIITKGNTRELLVYDSIKVKEVAIKDLITITIEHCRELSYDAEHLSSKLVMLGD